MVNPTSLAYADDMAIYARTRKSMIETFERLKKRTKEIGLIINEDKTKYLKMTKNTITGTKHHYRSIQLQNKFSYLGVHLNSRNNIHEEIAHRILSTNRTYYSLNKLFKFTLILRACKLTLYKTIIRPVLC